MRLIIATLMLLLMAGCNLPYRLPSGAGDTAKVRFFIPEAMLSATNIGVYVLPNGKCGSAEKVRLLGGLQLGGIATKYVDIGMLKDPRVTYENNSYVEIPIAAEKRFYFSLSGHHVFQDCNLTMSFVPRSGKQYEVAYFTDPKNCYVAINEITSGNGRLLFKSETTAEKAKTCGFFWN